MDYTTKWVKTLIMAITFIAVCIAPAAAFTGSGGGTAGDPYLITTPAQFAEMNNNLTAHYKLTADLNFSSYGPFEGIGSIDGTTPFSGSFDGGGHTIRNIELDVGSPTGTTYYTRGIFNIVSGSIRNVHVDKLHAEYTTTTGGTQRSAGALIGVIYTINGGTPIIIENNVLTNSVLIVTRSGFASNYGMGGIVGSVGYGETPGTSVTIQNCAAYNNKIQSKSMGATGLLVGLIRAPGITTDINNLLSYGSYAPVEGAGIIGWAGLSTALVTVDSVVSVANEVSSYGIGPSSMSYTTSTNVYRTDNNLIDCGFSTTSNAQHGTLVTRTATENQTWWSKTALFTFGDNAWAWDGDLKLPVPAAFAGKIGVDRIDFTTPGTYDLSGQTIYGVPTVTGPTGNYTINGHGATINNRIYTKSGAGVFLYPEFNNMTATDGIYLHCLAGIQGTAPDAGSVHLRLVDFSGTYVSFADSGAGASAAAGSGAAGGNATSRGIDVIRSTLTGDITYGSTGVGGAGGTGAVASGQFEDAYPSGRGGDGGYQMWYIVDSTIGGAITGGLNGHPGNGAAGTAGKGLSRGSSGNGGNGGDGGRGGDSGQKSLVVINSTTGNINTGGIENGANGGSAGRVSVGNYAHGRHNGVAGRGGNTGDMYVYIDGSTTGSILTKSPKAAGNGGGGAGFWRAFAGDFVLATPGANGGNGGNINVTIKNSFTGSIIIESVGSAGNGGTGGAGLESGSYQGGACSAGNGGNGGNGGNVTVTIDRVTSSGYINVGNSGSGGNGGKGGAGYTGGHGVDHYDVAGANGGDGGKGGTKTVTITNTKIANNYYQGNYMGRGGNGGAAGSNSGNNQGRAGYAGDSSDNIQIITNSEIPRIINTGMYPSGNSGCGNPKTGNVTILIKDMIGATRIDQNGAEAAPLATSIPGAFRITIDNVALNYNYALTSQDASSAPLAGDAYLTYKNCAIGNTITLKTGTAATDTAGTTSGTVYLTLENCDVTGQITLNSQNGRNTGDLHATYINSTIHTPPIYTTNAGNTDGDSGDIYVTYDGSHHATTSFTAITGNGPYNSGSFYFTVTNNSTLNNLPKITIGTPGSGYAAGIIQSNIDKSWIFNRDGNETTTYTANASDVKGTTYNNYINGPTSAQLGEFSEFLYIEPTAGTNILGDPWLAGNFWTNDNRTGYSDQWSGLCGAFYVPHSYGADNYPLLKMLEYQPTTRTVEIAESVSYDITTKDRGAYQIQKQWHTNVHSKGMLYLDEHTAVMAIEDEVLLMTNAGTPQPVTNTKGGTVLQAYLGKTAASVIDDHDAVIVFPYSGGNAKALWQSNTESGVTPPIYTAITSQHVGYILTIGTKTQLLIHNLSTGDFLGATEFTDTNLCANDAANTFVSYTPGQKAIKTYYWDAESNSIITTSMDVPTAVTNIREVLGQNTIVVTTTSNTYVYIIEANKKLTQQTISTSSMALTSPDGSINQYIGNYQNILYIFDTTGATVGTYAAGSRLQTASIARATGLWGVTGGLDNQIYFISKVGTSDWRMEQTIPIPHPITDSAISTNGEYAIVASDSRIYVFKLTEDPGDPKPGKNPTAELYLNGIVINTNGAPYKGKITINGEILNTDSAGKFVYMVTTGTAYTIMADGYATQYTATNVPYQTVAIKIQPDPYVTNIDYKAAWNPETQTIDLTYIDKTGRTNGVQWSIRNTATNEIVYEKTGKSGETLQYPVAEEHQYTNYVVSLSADRATSTGLHTPVKNTWTITPRGSGPINIPGLDDTGKNILFCGVLMVFGALFGVVHSTKGAVATALFAAALRYFELITIPWVVITIAAVIAILATLARGSGGE